MSANEKGKKDKKGKDKKDKSRKKPQAEICYLSSSDSCPSLPTKTVSLDSASTPGDHLNFEFPVDSPVVERRLLQEKSPEIPGACALSPKPSTSKSPGFVSSPFKQMQNKVSPSKDKFKDHSSESTPRKLQSKTSPSKDATEDSLPSTSPGKKLQHKTSSPMGFMQKKFEKFSTRKEEKKGLLEDDFSEDSSERLQPQPKTDPVPSHLGASKKRSSSLPPRELEERYVVPFSTFSKRTKSESQIQSKNPDQNLTPKKKSPLKRVLTKCRQVVMGSKRVPNIPKKPSTSTISECISESEEFGDAKDLAENPDEQRIAVTVTPSKEQNVSTAATPCCEPDVPSGAATSIGQSVSEATAPCQEPMDEESEQLGDSGRETPRRSRRRSNLDDEAFGSPSKRKDLK